MDKKIYLVEDNQSMVTLLKTILGIEGYQVAEPPKLRSNFIGSLLKFNPDLVLIDINYGMINGMDLLRKIRSIKKKNGLKVIMTSGMDREEECISIGADGFLLKPYIPDELIEKIEDLISE